MSNVHAWSDRLTGSSYRPLPLPGTATPCVPTNDIRCAALVLKCRPESCPSLSCYAWRCGIRWHRCICMCCGTNTGAHAGMAPVMPGYCRPSSNCTPADADPSRHAVNSAAKAAAVRMVCAMLWLPCRHWKHRRCSNSAAAVRCAPQPSQTATTQPPNKIGSRADAPQRAGYGSYIARAPPPCSVSGSHRGVSGRK